MWPILLLTLQAAQPAPPVTRYDVLAAEHLREAGVPVLRQGLQSPDTVVQRLAVRALGRLEKPEYAALLEPLFTSPAASVREAVARAVGQMKAPVVGKALPSERDPDVRGAWYAAAGRAMGASVEWELELVRGLAEQSTMVRRGAVRGLEAMIRLNARTFRPSPETVSELRRVVRETRDSETRLVALLALTGARDRDSTTVAAALTDRDPEVRRTAVAMGRVWVEDTSAIVRWQSLQAAPTCDRAAQRLTDASEHVVLLAIDQLGTLKCDATKLRALTAATTPWRQRAHATMALTKVDTAAARAAARALAGSPAWQARAWAAQAARAVRDSATLARLARDAAPNVAIAAMSTPAEALAALTRDHAGVVLEASELLAKQPAYDARWTAPLASAFARIARDHGMTWRDPLVGIMKAMRGRDAATLNWLGARLYDRDPGVAKAAADQIKTLTGSAVEPVTRMYTPAAFPSAVELFMADSVAAEITIRGKGTMLVLLQPSEAPMAVTTFVRMARAGRYTGNTIHRIVPNFVVQGGSPGADEYDPVTADFMRDEVGGENRRGTFGISTRGRDTGDGQLYMNLIYNLRLDGDYTVFGTIVRGLDVMDRIQEGDVISAIRILKADLVRAVK
ncbi:MAG: peptidylprolyl isomerase [Gemmatimonadaceae bacterium]|nr:peptidylprolyl isomerase [Gemmatimonadaceae bacterium]